MGFAPENRLQQLRLLRFPAAGSLPHSLFLLGFAGESGLLNPLDRSGDPFAASAHGERHHAVQLWLLFVSGGAEGMRLRQLREGVFE